MNSLILSSVLSMAAFAFVGSLTPGPNTIIAASIGAHSGWRAAWPHACGVAVGFGAMLVLAGLGVAGLLQMVPSLAVGMRLAAAAYLFWLALQMARSRSSSLQLGLSSMSFTQSVGFQFLNPKAWTLAAATVSVEASDSSPLSLMAVVLIFATAAITSILLWSMLGEKICAWATTPRRVRRLNCGTAVLLALTAAWMLT